MTKLRGNQGEDGWNGWNAVKRFAEALLDQAVETKDETLVVGRGEKNLDAGWLKAYNEKSGSN